VSAWSIDTTRARSLARGWIRHGDELADLQQGAELDVEQLHLGTSQSTVVQRLASASTRLWVSAAFTDLVLRQVEAADAGSGFAALDVGTVGVLLHQAGDRVRVSQADACLPPWVMPASSSMFGDFGGTFGAEVRSPFYVTGSTPDARGRSLVVRALADTANGTQIRADEFELIELANGAYLIVLAGVVDLSHPHLGLDDRHRTVRDVDVYALPSSRSAAVADNRYAQLVRDGLAEAGVPEGAQLMIVGHSFGADTALDLAADPAFTSQYRLTHVVAAAYHSEPQLRHVDPLVNVLVLQNHRDIPVMAESVAHGHPTDFMDSVGGVIDSAWDRDFIGVVTHQVGALHHAGGTAVDVVTHTVDHVDELSAAVADVGLGRPAAVWDDLSDLVTLDPRVEWVGDRQLLDVFEGGGAGAGHHQSNYIDHVESTDDQPLVDFFASVDSAGFATTGTSWAIDVSVPVGAE
jgi:hypothetical protein